MPPKPKITPQEIAHYAEWMCSQQEIAEVLGVNQSTISRLLQKPEYQKAYSMARAQTKYKLRRKQIENALDGKTVDGIWLGKQYLDQRDSVHQVEQKTNVQIKYIAEWGGRAPELEAGEDVPLIEGEAEEEV